MGGKHGKQAKSKTKQLKGFEGSDDYVKFIRREQIRRE